MEVQQYVHLTKQHSKWVQEYHVNQNCLFHRSQLRVCDRDGSIIEYVITATNCLVPAELMDKMKDDTLSQPEYCNIDMADALSVHEVCTI